MPLHDFASQRLFVDAPLAAGGEIELGKDQANYLVNVLRMAAGDGLLIFNGREGEWRARLAEASKRRVVLAVEARVRPQPPGGDLWYLFAPLKHARLDYMVQKAVEMGASHLVPVITRRTQVARVNGERMAANVVEAAEQCAILEVPTIAEPAAFDRLIADWPSGRRLIFCDESAEMADPLATLAALPRGPLAVLVGPEGGFDPAERAALLRLPAVTPIALGPRILRADTAAVAALAVVQAVLGDWAAR